MPGDTVWLVTPGEQWKQEATPASPVGRPSTSSDRDQTITRLAVLKAAAEYAASRPESKSADVLKIAASWERWVNRESAAEDEIVDAF